MPKNDSFNNCDNNDYIGFLSLCLLDDGRLASGGIYEKITIYNKITFKPDIIINDHIGCAFYIIKWNSNILVSCSPIEITLIKIKLNEYEILHTLIL